MEELGFQKNEIRGNLPLKTKWLREMREIYL
jgi:hypothetical protein